VTARGVKTDYARRKVTPSTRWSELKDRNSRTQRICTRELRSFSSKGTSEDLVALDEAFIHLINVDVTPPTKLSTAGAFFFSQIRTTTKEEKNNNTNDNVPPRHWLTLWMS